MNNGTSGTTDKKLHRHRICERAFNVVHSMWDKPMMSGPAQAYKRLKFLHRQPMTHEIKRAIDKVLVWLVNYKRTQEN